MDVKNALEELSKEKKRKFSQSLDLIVNLKGIDLRRENINAIISVPHKPKDKKVCGFMDKKSDLVDTITKLDFPKYKDKKTLKNLVKKYDFFIAIAPLMPSVATTFGKILGPAGKMPSPQLGIINQESSDAINHELSKISKSIKIRVKETSIKVSIGNEAMPQDQLMDNIRTVFNGIVNALPKKKDNIKNVMVKYTMSKPIKVEGM
ncbi:MAG: hypothetical protein Q7S27_06195 [Nanoarchaeota archaeon]|nr:hypothetical protein [Nanoarchaeota archaeon]